MPPTDTKLIMATTATQNGTSISAVAVLPLPAYPPSYSPTGQGQQNPPGRGQQSRPEAPVRCPPGLECLTQLDKILVDQQVEGLEVLTSSETQNKYQIKNSLGQQVLFAAEESDACSRSWCGTARSFVMHVVDNTNQEVIRINRPSQFCAGCSCFPNLCSCCALGLSVEAPPGQPIGHVRQRSSMWDPHFDILDANFKPLLKIRGPRFLCQGICDDPSTDFRLMSYDESQQVGKISKTANTFGITFPMDLDVKVKGTLMGALFLIDVVFFAVIA